MEITTILMNFNSVLFSIATAVLNLGLDGESEVWDELTENAFEHLVLSPVKELNQSQSLAEYDVWVSYDANAILVDVRDGAEIMVGTEDNTQDLIKFKSIVADLKFFHFVGFGNPCMDNEIQLIESLSFVYGRNIRGEHVCVSVADCTFRVSSN